MSSSRNLCCSSSDGAIDRWQRSSGEGAEMEHNSLKSLSESEREIAPLVKA